MRTEFAESATESDVEQFFLNPLLQEQTSLGIPDLSILTKHSIRRVEIDKGRHRRWYSPDYVVYSETLPLLVVEAKSPSEDVSLGFSEAQLYAHTLNRAFPAGVNPANFVIACNGIELLYGAWDASHPVRIALADVRTGQADFEDLRVQFSWDALQEYSSHLRAKLFPEDLSSPYEILGENRVRLAKVGYNSLYEELDPLLRRYFDSRNIGSEDEIVEKAYVASDEITRYERSFENFLRERTVHPDDPLGLEISTSRRGETALTARIETKSMTSNRGYLQLIIGGVGAGKTTFIKRYFDYLIDNHLKQRLVVCRLNFNQAPDDRASLADWVCENFIDRIREGYSDTIDLTTEDGLRSVFSQELRSNKGAYDLLRKADPSAYGKRVAEDLLGWMKDRSLFAKALARTLARERRKGVVVIFDNVDRRDREGQLQIFQTAQWFMAMTQSICIITLRDDTYENYKEEKPLDTYAKSGNFYIKPPRFVDMIRRRLDLAVAGLSESSEMARYDIEGLGTITYPKTRLGNYLTSVYVDLFRRKRKITMILEGLGRGLIRPDPEAD